MVKQNLDYRILLSGILIGRTSLEFSFIVYLFYLYIILYFETYHHVKRH